jgi:hypothetical protein
MDNNIQKTEAKPSKIVIPKKIYKEKEYSAVLQLIKKHKFTTIRTVSKILGIRYQTLQLWMKTPRVQKALVEEIDYFIDKMKKAGKNDWRMWDRLIQYSTGNKTEEQKIAPNIIIVNNENEFSISEG